jgi:site-specific recombinase XerD
MASSAADLRWVRQLQDAGTAASTVTRRLSALSGFYKHAAAHDLIAGIPTDGVRRPEVDPDYTATIGLDREEARALIAAADADGGRQQLRTAEIIRLLLHNGLRVDELCAADIADLGHDRGHRTLAVVRKGARPARVPLAPSTTAAIDTYLTARAEAAGLSSVDQLAGPLAPPRPGVGSSNTSCGG